MPYSGSVITDAAYSLLIVRARSIQLQRNDRVEQRSTKKGVAVEKGTAAHPHMLALALQNAEREKADRLCSTDMALRSLHTWAALQGPSQKIALQVQLMADAHDLSHLNEV